MNIDVSRVPVRDVFEAVAGFEDRVVGFKTFGALTILEVH